MIEIAALYSPGRCNVYVQVTVFGIYRTMVMNRENKPRQQRGIDQELKE
jgi:hypothetical protein